MPEDSFETCWDSSAGLSEMHVHYDGYEIPDNNNVYISIYIYIIEKENKNKNKNKKNKKKIQQQIGLAMP